jgi:transposase InsO family protein
LKWLPIVDECSRELLSIEVARSITGEDVVRDLERLVRERGAPDYIRSDNGPEFVARAVRDWIEAKGFKTCFIEPGSPWQNAYIESFNSRFRDEFLNLEVFGSLLEAKMLGEEHRYKYSHQRLHSSLGTPRRSSRHAVLLRYDLRPPLRRTVRTNHNYKPNSHRSWFKERGHSKRIHGPYRRFLVGHADSAAVTKNAAGAVRSPMWMKSTAKYFRSTQ